ncbi:MAG TPA: hypothetical protein VM536_21815 [Chloroflexia bacterium]|nr:hypothetical protein [Chloroflexia bacterium]
MPHMDEVGQLLARAGSNVVTATAYDTAWLAALASDAHAPSPRPLFPESLEWLTTHQHPDGSWGAPWPYYHDRLISTLRAVLSLDAWCGCPATAARIQRGLTYIWANAERLAHDPWETVGFELIFPALLAKAEERHMALPFGAFDQVRERRREKLARAPMQWVYNRTTPLPVTLEALGPEFRADRLNCLQEDIGCVGMSPSSTAFLLQQAGRPDGAYAYLVRAVQEGPGDGGAPAYFPLETFERSWMLYQLQQAVPDLYARFLEETTPLLDALYRTRQPHGWTASVHSSVKEADTTAVCFAVLSQAGYDLDPGLLYQFEESDHFRCYPFEMNASSSVHAHLLSAFRYCPPRESAPRVEKALGFLRRARRPAGYWFDKWHVSPFYATSRVIAAAHAIAPDLTSPAVEWILHTQWEGGAWGYYAPTVEETAYALLALFAAHDHGARVPLEVLQRGADYLLRHFSPISMHYPPLWIHKSLYTPVQAVQGAVFAAAVACEARL